MARRSGDDRVIPPPATPWEWPVAARDPLARPYSLPIPIPRRATPYDGPWSFSLQKEITRYDPGADTQMSAPETTAERPESGDSSPRSYTPASECSLPSLLRASRTPMSGRPESGGASPSSHTPSSPDYVPSSPDYIPVSPDYVPSSPDYTPVSPAYTPTSPSYSPSSPYYWPSSPIVRPESGEPSPSSPQNSRANRAPAPLEELEPLSEPLPHPWGVLGEDRRPESMNFLSDQAYAELWEIRGTQTEIQRRATVEETSSLTMAQMVQALTTQRQNSADAQANANSLIRWTIRHRIAFIQRKITPALKYSLKKRE